MTISNNINHRINDCLRIHLMKSLFSCLKTHSNFNLNVRTFFKTTFEPHSKEYLHLQLKLLKQKNITGEMTTLDKGHLVVIANINSEHLIRDIPAYDFHTLPLLTPYEMKKFYNRCYKDGAGLSIASLVETLHCIKLPGDKGSSLFYINRFKLHSNLNTLQTFQDFMRNYVVHSAPESSLRKSP